MECYSDSITKYILICLPTVDPQVLMLHGLDPVNHIHSHCIFPNMTHAMNAKNLPSEGENK